MTPRLRTAVEQALSAMSNLQGSVVVSEVSWAIDLTKQIKDLTSAMEAEPDPVLAGYFRKKGGNWLQYSHEYPNPEQLTELYSIPDPKESE